MSAHTLYGVEISYFSGKARSYLRWRGVDFCERPADIAFYQNVCVPRIGYPMIPLLITADDDAIQDTTLIMDHFESRAHRGASLVAAGQVQQLVARLFELYADDWLILPAMHYRWEYDAAETMLEFGMNLLPHASLDEQRVLGEKSAAQFRGALPFLGVHPHNKHLVEASWRELLQELDAHFRQRPYLFGERPCTGDFALFGALYAHLYRDATAGALMRREALAVARYVERMLYPGADPWGDYLPEDQIPDTLIPILTRMMTEQMPCLVATAQRVAEWREEHPEEPIPRAMGVLSFDLQGISAKRGVQPYSSWLHGRALESYRDLAGASLAAANRLLDQCAGDDFRNCDITAPLVYRDYRLHWHE